jgi:hypothetical protein
MLCFINIAMFIAAYSKPAFRTSHPTGSRVCQTDFALGRRGRFLLSAANTKTENNWSTTDMVNKKSTLSTGIHRVWIAVTTHAGCRSLTTPTT